MSRLTLTRRDFLRLSTAGVAASLVPACGGGSGAALEPDPGKGRLGSRPTPPSVRPALRTGMQPLGIGSGRDGVLYLPAGHDPAAPAPMLLLLHGAGGSGQTAVRRLESFADRAGFIVAAPDSRDETWDALTDEYGPDVAFIDRVLAGVFTRCAVDPDRVAVAGFSDGATYALALARINGDLFSRGIAFSPGFLLPVTPRKFPRLFVSHGTGDRVLPIDRCSRTLVPLLRQAGYQVRYREFDGGHEVPPAIAADAVRWFVGDGA